MNNLDLYRIKFLLPFDGCPDCWNFSRSAGIVRKVVRGCRRRNEPMIVAPYLLNS
jgi:hypothetical protein